MGTKHVRLDEDVYERIKSQKREDETFSDAIDRLAGDYTLLDFAAEFAGEDEKRWEEERALIEATESEREDRAVSDEELESMPERVSNHFDRIRDHLE